MTLISFRTRIASVILAVKSIGNYRSVMCMAYNHCIKLLKHAWKAWRLHLISSFHLIHLVVTNRLPASGKNSFSRELSPSIWELNRNSNTTSLSRFLLSRTRIYKLPRVGRSLISISRIWTSEQLLTLIFINTLFLNKNVAIPEN